VTVVYQDRNSDSGVSGKERGQWCIRREKVTVVYQQRKSDSGVSGYKRRQWCIEEKR